MSLSMLIGKTKKMELFIQLAALLFAIISTLTTLYFSIASERKKEITIWYLAKQPLLIGDESVRLLNVSYSGEPVKKPWLLSVRVENTGGLPIESKDIEKQLTFIFSGARVLESEITSRSQSAIFAETVTSSNELQINHKLMNSQDWIELNVFLDGEPEFPVLVEYRISGLASLVVNYPLETKMMEVDYVFPGLSRGLGFAVLLMSSAFIFMGVWFSFSSEHGVIQILKNQIRRFRRVPISDVDFFVADVVGGRIDFDALSCSILESLEGELKLRDFDNLAIIESKIVKEVPAELLVQWGGDAKIAAEYVVNKLKVYLPVLLGEFVLSRGQLFSGQILYGDNSVKYRNMTLSEVAQEFKRSYELAHLVTPLYRKIDFYQILNLIIILAFCISVLIFNIGAWLKFIK